MMLKITFGLTVTLIVSVVCAQEPEVKISQGVIKGKYGTTSNGRKISEFTGIPYAKPPVGELRFKEPVASEQWIDTLDATKSHSVCPQYDTATKTVIGEEDCLFINVFTPEAFTSETLKSKMPVMFYIHGGGWVYGSANDIKPNLLLNKDVVLVTVNYRLGPLGFFSTGDSYILPNNGLKDQVLAIKWVKSNIENFGGDPNNIVLFGQSSGGASAHFHMLSPLSKDLISGVIIQSGSALSNWALMPHFLTARHTKYLAGGLGCDTFDPIKMMNCLYKADAHDFIRNMTEFQIWREFPFTVFKPVIEFNYYPTAFLTEDPIDIIKAGKAADIPIMTGFTTDEGDIRTLAYDIESLDELNQNFSTLAPLVFHFGETAAPKYLKDANERIRNYYFDGKHIDESSKTELSNLIADAEIITGEDVAVMLHAKYSKKPVYYYLFGYKGSESFCSLVSDSPKEYGVCHGDELFHLFDLAKFPNHQPNKEDNAITELLTSLWTNFATYGNPTPNNNPNNLVQWDPVSIGKHNQYFIKNSDEIELVDGLFEERKQFWRNLQLSSRTTKVRDEL